MHCKACNSTKTPGDFYSCNKTRCKECIKAGANAYRQANLEKVRSYDRMRGSQAHRVAARKEYAQTPQGKAAFARAGKKYYNDGAGKEARKRFLQSEKGRASRRESHLKDREKHPDRHQARVSFGNAVRDGRVIPWPVCAIPECCGKPHGHHPDYSRPLDVVWLCDKHHKEAHALVRKAA